MAGMYRAIINLSIFLQMSPSHSAGLRGQVSDITEEVDRSLLLALSESRRSDNSVDHIAGLEIALKQMYAAVPHEDDGTLNHAVVNYVLHRFFVKEHGWYIQGLEPGTGGKSLSTQPQILQSATEWVPDYLQRFLEKLNGKAGIGLRDLAVIASTIDDLIHKENLERLEQAFVAMDINLSTVLENDMAKQILEIWMMMFMSRGKFTVKGHANVLRAHEVFVQQNRDWGQLQEWVHTLRTELFPSQDTLNFTEAARVVEAVGRRYGSYNDAMCRSLKEELLSVEAKKAGRVRLAEFYKKGLKGLFEFDEKIEYLRALGVLDESDPKQPHVIVPNYISSRANCLVTSSFYVVCCRNECEDFLGLLEKQIGSEMAPPDQVLKIVAGIRPATHQVQAHEARIQRIADMNAGLVPLHGRLFAQWMHHVFPRECPYPHESGKISPQTPDEWMQETGQEDSRVSREEMMDHISNDTCGPDEPIGEEARKHQHFAENELPWDESEELLRPVRSTKGVAPTFKSLATFFVLSSAISLLLIATRQALIGAGHRKTDLLF
jgi:hypothetical protein